MPLGAAWPPLGGGEREASKPASSQPARPPCKKPLCGTADKTLDEGSDPPRLDFAGDSRSTGTYLANSRSASSARTPPVIVIGTNRAFAATSALEIMISSILAAICCTDAAKTSRPIRHHRIAPMHITHGSPEV